MADKLVRIKRDRPLSFTPRSESVKHDAPLQKNRRPHGRRFRVVSDPGHDQNVYFTVNCTAQRCAKSFGNVLTGACCGW